jgi:aminoglycoside phosphotransferase family enzyme
MSAGNATGPTPGSHVVADQSAAIAVLCEPASYGLTGEAVERIDTHGAVVFLAGERAYKMKRAVRFPYMDFSTVQKRRKAVERELRFNRRTAPGLYLGAMALLRDRGGALRLGEIQPEGPDDALERQDKELEPVEWLVVMRRFDQQRLFDRMARDGELGPGHLDALGEVVAAFHESAEPVQRRGIPGASGVLRRS